MGDRVAVMRKGELQQVATPQELYDRPVNLFVGGFIGSPSMNMLEAQARGASGDGSPRASATSASRSGRSCSTRARARATTPGETVVLGIRPEDLEDAALAGDAPAGPPPARRRSSCARRWARRSSPTSRRRARRPQTEEVARAGRGRSAPQARRSRRRRRREATIVGRFGARSRSREGDAVEVAVDTRALHFFDPETGPRRSTTNDRHRGGTTMKARQRAELAWLLALLLVALAAALARRRAAAATTTTRRHGGTAASAATTRTSAGRSASLGIWTGDEQKSFQAVLDGFNETVPERQGQVHLRRATTCRPCSAPRSRAATRPTSPRSPQPGLIEEFAAEGRAQAARLRRATPRSNNLGRVVDARRRSTASSTASSSRRPTSRPSGTTSQVFEDAGVEPPDDWDEFLDGGRHHQGLRRARLLDRRRRRLDAHRPVREHLPAPGRAGEVRPARDARDPVDRPVGQGRADRDGQDLQRHGATSPAARAARCRPTSRRRSSSVFTDPPKAAHGHRGRLRPGASSSETKLKAGDGLRRRSRSRRSSGSGDGASSAAATRRDVQGHAGRRRRSSSTSPRPRRPRSGPSAAASRRRTRTSTPSVYPDDITRTIGDRRSPRRETFRFDMSDLAPAGVRRHAGPGRVEDPAGLPREPERRRRHRRSSSRRPPRRPYK